MRARLLLVLAASSSSACFSHVDSPIAPDDESAVADCENRITYIGAVDGTYAPTIYAHATTTASFQYDRGGRIVRYRESAADGTTVSQIDRTYERTGQHRPLVRTFSAIYRPSPVIFRWTYDDAQHAIQTDDDELINGHWLRTTAGERYDETGRIVFAWAAVDRRGDLTFTYTDANHIVGTTPADGLIQRITLVDGRLVTRTENLYRDRIDSTEVTTYDDKLRPLARVYTSPSGNETTTIEWDGDRVRSVTKSAPSHLDRRVESFYDVEGRLVEKRFRGPDSGNPWTSDTSLSFTWEGARLVHVERRKLDARAVLQSWDFAYGCAFTNPKDVTDFIAPMNEWSRAMEPVPFTYDFRAYWAPIDR